MLDAVGLPGEEAAAWKAEGPKPSGSLDADWKATRAYLERGEALLERLPANVRRGAARGEAEPPLPVRREPERTAAEAIARSLAAARDAFLRAHAEAVYAELTNDHALAVRDDELLQAAAERFPGLVPGRAELAAELERRLAEKEGVELAQGVFLARVLGSPRSGAHLIDSMLRPTEAALERLDDFRATGAADLGAVQVTREGRAGVLELRNPRHLNAEDDTTIAASELGADLVLLDPEIEIGVLRGGPVDHPRYGGRRVFGAGLNLTRLYRGRIPFLFFVTRDLGYVHKIFRGLSGPRAVEKPWIAAVETYAIGGACQLLHVVDHVIAARGSRLYLPARKEGIIPGASNLRLPRFVGDRLARQAILSGLEFEAGTPRGDLVCDEVVEEDELEAALAARVDALTGSGLVSVSANRRALRAGEEPLDVFREYMAVYAEEQARCHLSPALVRNLEEHWRAHEREL